MPTRKVVIASAAALALAVMSYPVASAQDDGAATGSLPSSGLFGGSLEQGSLSGLSSGGSGGGAGTDSAGDGGGAGSLGSVGGGSSELVPESDMMCELPDLGGSVAKFYPLFGISGVPTGVIDLVTSALDSFPNLFEIVAGEGAGAALLWQTGSLSDGLCTSILGGEMVMPPETVYVDPDGTPTSTITGTPTPGAGSSGSGGPDTSVSPEATDGDEAQAETAPSTTETAPSTTVPLP